MSKWKCRVSNPGAPLEVISSHLMDGKMRLGEGSQPPGLRNELVAQSGLGLGRNMTATFGDFSLLGAGHRVAPVSQNLGHLGCKGKADRHPHHAA